MTLRQLLVPPLIAALLLAQFGCFATTRTLWAKTDPNPPVTRLALADAGDGTAALLVHTTRETWALPLDRDGRPPVALDASEWGGRSALALDAASRGDVATNEQLVDALRRHLVAPRDVPAAWRAAATPIAFEAFALGDGLFVAFYDPLDLPGESAAPNALPPRAIVLPTHLRRAGGSAVLDGALLAAGTPVTLALDLGGTAAVVAAGTAGLVILSPFAGLFIAAYFDNTVAADLRDEPRLSPLFPERGRR